MNWIDYSILVMIALSVVMSLMRGFVRESLSLLIWLFAFIVSSRFYTVLTPYLTFDAEPLIKNGVAIAIIFVATLFCGALLNFLIGQLVVKTGLSSTDRLLGAIFGLLRGVLIVAALLFFLDAFTALQQSHWWQESTLIPEFSFIIQWFFDFFASKSTFLKFEPWLQI
ncbi:MAG: CvpA family protein [Shewanellaceae bacterium]|nr:CvpA family protein [Shewanellaceae bacterium]